MTTAKTEIPPIKFLGSIHEGIPVATEMLDECIEFFTGVLGLKVLPRPPALDKLGPGAWLGDEDDTVQFHLIANDGAVKPRDGAGVEPASRHTAWRIEDAEIFRNRMRALDIHFEEISNLIGEAQLFVIDPQGNTWEFQEQARAG